MPRRTLSVLVTAATLGALAVASPPALAAAAAVPDITALTQDGHPQHVLEASAEVTTGLSLDSTTSSLSLSGGGRSVGVSMPTGATFEVGTYPARRFADGENAALSLLGRQGAGCNEVAGEVTIHEVELAGPVVARFAASYSFSCDGAEPVIGELRWHARTPYLRFGDVPLGGSDTRTLTITAPEAQTLGSAEVVGIDSDGFRILGDTCSDEALAAGDTCAVTVEAWPTQVEPARAELTIPVAGGDPYLATVSILGHDTPDGAYTGLAPKRVLDTRSRNGVTTTTPIGAGKSVDVQVTGRGGVPATHVSAVVLNVTAIAPTSRGYLTVYPSTAPRPTASSINFNQGWTGANLVTVPIAAGGKVRIFNASGSTHVAADVVGYYHSVTSTAVPASAQLGSYESVDPTRLVDTRTADWDSEPLGPREFLWSPVDFDEEFNQRVQAVALNVTVVGPTRQGHVTAFNGDSADDIPATSTLNFTAGRTVPNMTIVKTGRCYAECDSPVNGVPRFGIANASLGNVHVVVDIVGVYFEGAAGDSGWRFRALDAPTRFVDSRKGQGLSSNLGPNQARTILAPGSIAGYNTMALVTNTTAAQPTSTTVLTLWANSGAPRPEVSNLNPYAGQVVSNMTITEVWDQNDFRVHNRVGTTPLVIDAAGTFEIYPPFGPPGEIPDALSSARGTADRSSPERASSVRTPTTSSTGAVERQ